MDRTDLAWAAGFWDGEGSAYLTGGSGRRTKQPQARINQSSTTGVPEVLIRFQRIVGLGRIRGPQLSEGREPLYQWTVSSRADVLTTYRALAPWLGPVKRDQFVAVLGTHSAEVLALHVASADERLAWAAGLFDGEGSTYLDKHKTHSGFYRLEAAITQSDCKGTPFVLVEFRRIFQIGTIYGPYDAGPGRDPVYRWKAHRAPQVIAMIQQLRPNLGSVKREQADAAVAVVTAQPALLRGNPAWGNRKSHCVNGHEYATARVRPFHSRGVNAEPRRASAQCLACLREYARKKRDEKRKPSRGRGAA